MTSVTQEEFYDIEQPLVQQEEFSGTIQRSRSLRKAGSLQRRRWLQRPNAEASRRLTLFLAQGECVDTNKVPIFADMLSLIFIKTFDGKYLCLDTGVGLKSSGQGANC